MREGKDRYRDAIQLKIGVLFDTVAGYAGVGSLVGRRHALDDVGVGVTRPGSLNRARNF